jgi:hypothetical protein
MVCNQAFEVTEMLYQDKTLGRTRPSARLFARLAIALARRRHDDLDLLSMSPHLRRDIGMGDFELDRPAVDFWRK